MSVPDLALCAVGDPDRPPRSRDLKDAVDWFAWASGGAVRLCPVALPAVTLDHPLTRYAIAGGLAANGPTSRELVAEVIAALQPTARAVLAGAGGRLGLILPLTMRPHVWTPRNGGVALGGGAWCRRFMVLPAEAPLGTVAHELGHLLFDWPDGQTGHPGAEDCLMARGARTGGGQDPASPSAPLRAQANWGPVSDLTARLTTGELAAMPPSTILKRDQVWVERRGSRLLAWTGPAARPRRLVSIHLEGWPATTPVLGLLAPVLRRHRGNPALQAIPC